MCFIGLLVVAMASLLVAVEFAIKAMVRNRKNRKEGGTWARISK